MPFIFDDSEDALYVASEPIDIPSQASSRKGSRDYSTEEDEEVIPASPPRARSPLASMLSSEPSEMPLPVQAPEGFVDDDDDDDLHMDDDSSDTATQFDHNDQESISSMNTRESVRALAPSSPVHERSPSPTFPQYFPHYHRLASSDSTFDRPDSIFPHYQLPVIDPTFPPVVAPPAPTAPHSANVVYPAQIYEYHMHQFVRFGTPVPAPFNSYPQVADCQLHMHAGGPSYQLPDLWEAGEGRAAASLKEIEELFGIPQAEPDTDQDQGETVEASEASSVMSTSAPTMSFSMKRFLES